MKIILSPEDLTDVYNQEQRHERSSENRGSAIPYDNTITEGVRQILEEQDNAFVAGEDVGEAGSVYGYYRGLIDQFGEHRIIDTPISEKGIIGLGVGAAATGCRPILDIMFMDFLGSVWTKSLTKWPRCDLCWRWRNLAITVLTMAGAGMNLAAQHSQSWEAILCCLV